MKKLLVLLYLSVIVFSCKEKECQSCIVTKTFYNHRDNVRFSNDPEEQLICGVKEESGIYEKGKYNDHTDYTVFYDCGMQ